MILQSTPNAFVNTEHVICATYQKWTSRDLVESYALHFRLNDKSSVEVLYDSEDAVIKDIHLINEGITP